MADVTLLAILRKVGAGLEGTEWTLITDDDRAVLEEALPDGKEVFEIPVTPAGVMDFSNFVDKVKAGAGMK